MTLSLKNLWRISAVKACTGASTYLAGIVELRLVILFILMTPRPILYGYVLALAPALWIVLRVWKRALHRVAVVGALTVQGFALRGLGRLDFIPNGLAWPVQVVIASLPFLMLLALWLAFVRAPRPGLNLS